MGVLVQSKECLHRAIQAKLWRVTDTGEVLRRIQLLGVDQMSAKFLAALLARAKTRCYATDERVSSRMAPCRYSFPNPVTGFDNVLPADNTWSFPVVKNGHSCVTFNCVDGGRDAKRCGRLMLYVATKIFFTKGVGRHREKLSSFEMALRQAGIAQFNLVRVSSIYPPGCRQISRQAGLKQMMAGQIVPVVMSENATNEPNRLVAASVGVATPTDRSGFGYLSEHHSFGETNEKAGDYAEDLAADMLATVLGVDFDPDSSWDERREIWRISGKIYRTLNKTQTAVGNKFGLWTTVVAAAVLLP